MTLSISEKREIIQDFRTRLADLLKTEYHHSESFLLRWLEAKDYNLNKAEEMIRSSFAWRQDNNIDSLAHKKFDSYFTTKYPYDLKGVDRCGNPVLTLHFGAWDIKKAVSDGKSDEYTEYATAIFERILLAVQAGNDGKDLENDRCTGATAVVDLEGYSYSQVLSMKVLQICMKVTSDLEAHYPGFVFKAILINCPRVFSMLWKVIHPLLSQRNRDAIMIRGSKRSDWESDVQAAIDPKIIKIQYGGELEI